MSGTSFWGSGLGCCWDYKVGVRLVKGVGVEFGGRSYSVRQFGGRGYLVPANLVAEINSVLAFGYLVQIFTEGEVEGGYEGEEDKGGEGSESGAVEIRFLSGDFGDSEVPYEDT